jgi:hypothetical protein
VRNAADDTGKSIIKNWDFLTISLRLVQVTEKSTNSWSLGKTPF